MRSLPRVIALAAVALAIMGACTPGGPSSSPKPTTAPPPSAQRAAATTPTPREADVQKPEERTRNTPTPVAGLAQGVRVTPYAEGIVMPVALAFAPDGRLFFNEHGKGQVRIIEADGTLRPEPFAQVKTTAWKEQGALGLALDPGFAQNHFVYLFYTQSRGDTQKPDDNRIVRFTEQDGVGTERTVILKDLPVGICCHNGGRIGFGPDGKLYVTIGDVNEDDKAQNPARLHGKILRVNADGSVPSDNPDPTSPVFALGFRNPYGLAFHPKTGVPYVSENGEVGHDEIDRVVAGGNYGNPKYDGRTGTPGFVDPIWETVEGRVAPSGAAFYTGAQMPEYQGDFFFCAFNTGDLTRMRFGGQDGDHIAQQDVIYRGCHLDVVDGPDGALYFSTFTGIFRLGR